LEVVAALRDEQRRDRAFGASVLRVKEFQHGRFERTYADLLRGRFAKAARFFLDDLYGPHDFSERDAQFARIVPALVRLFPDEIVGTVTVLAELHALSERLDSEMARQLIQESLDLAEYRVAWQVVGQRESRFTQIELMLDIGAALQRYTRSPLLRGSLRMMRGPAKAAGLAALQAFLEHGFDTFRDLGKDAPAFLRLISERERAVVTWLFNRQTSDPPPPGFE
jgi:hypothetical protein